MSGATSYTTLCVAAKNEERRMTELRRGHQYSKPPTKPPVKQQNKDKASDNKPKPTKVDVSRNRNSSICDKLGHFARDCPQGRERAKVLAHAPKDDKSTKPGSVTNRRVYSDTDESPGEAPAGVPDPLDLLLSDSDGESGVWRIELNDTGSEPKCAPVQVQGVPAKGIIDSGSEITIVGAHLRR